MLKVDLHTHTADDPVDRISHTTTDLIDRAAALGYDALAVTLHDRQLDVRPLAPYAADRGIVLLPGVERTIEGRHVLLINFRRGADGLRTFDDLARLKAASRGEPALVIAPHPFFPLASCLREQMDRHADLFDAVECNAMFTSALNFNVRAEQWARRRGTPIVGNGDVHRLRQLGTTFSLVDAPRDPDAICDAIAAGHVTCESHAIGWLKAAGVVADMMCADHVLGRRGERSPILAPARLPDLH
ncbi:MAG TPA: PHP-associated domain-containing protein [Thermoanaerobaculia bacterium]|nr:PHP-associated domain-containing protein [Thermoanaerobaculia bacterium]